MTAAFFHQNAVGGVQGGIERYLATLLTQGGQQCVLVCEDKQNTHPQICGLSLPDLPRCPQWLLFVIAVWQQVFKIRRFLKDHSVTAIEFSRPEYVLFSFLFRGKKVFTFHGTGPAPAERGKYFIHHAACWLMPLCADGIRVIGRDIGALPKFIREIMRDKITFIDAWYDPVFTPAPFPTQDNGTHVFYAGRLAKMKNPDLLFSIIRYVKLEHGQGINFHYFGSDGDKIPADIRNTLIIDHGLMSALALASAIQSCHMGILCSGYGEGSPFIIVETLACGRGYVLPPLPGLVETYKSHAGVRFATDYTPESFAKEIIELAKLVHTDLTPDVIAQSVKGQAQAVAAKNLIKGLLA